MTKKTMHTLVIQDQEYEVVDKSAREDIDELKTSSAIKMSNILNVGQIFEKPKDLPYCGWAFNNVKYDPDINSVVFLINAARQHGDNANTHLYMGTMNLDSYDVSIKEIGDPAVLNHGFYTMGFCINDDGDYLYIDAQSKMLGKSTDKGETWTETDISTYNSWAENITQLSNGRYLFWGDGSTKGVWYSDDDCATWTKATMSNAKYEGSFLELTDGKVMCFMRKSTNGTSNGAWNGTKIQEPIVISISNDYGATWSAATDSTTLLEGCANIATAFYHKDEDQIEVFTSPRFPYGDTYGAVWQYIAKREDALNDNFGTPKLVTYAKAHAYQDFGHIGGCLDGNGDIHLMYYDGDASVSGSVNYYYLKASRNQATLPVNKAESSVFIPYSGVQTDSKILALRKELMTKINEIIIAGGGDVDDPDFYVTDGLVIDINFDDTSKIDATNGTIKDTFGTEFTGTFDSTTKALTDLLTIPTATLQSKITDNTQFTVEVCMNVIARAANNDAQILRYKDQWTTFLGGRHINYRWTKTGSTNGSEILYFQNWDNRSAKTDSLIDAVKLTQIALVFKNDGTVLLYNNNILIHTYTCTDFASYANALSQKWLVKPNSTYWTYKTVRMYNKALTASEIEQNYNYLNQ